MKDEVTNVLRLANLVRENIRAKQLFTPHNSIVVTLSGGQDSLCSLLFLYLLQNQLGLNLHARTKPVLTANFNSSFPRSQTLTFRVPAVELSVYRPSHFRFAHFHFRALSAAACKASSPALTFAKRKCAERSSARAGKGEGAGEQSEALQAKVSRKCAKVKVSESAVAERSSAANPAVTFAEPRRGERKCVDLKLGLSPRIREPVRKAGVTVPISTAGRSGKGTTLFGRADPPAEYGQTKHIFGVSVDRSRQLNKSVRVARFSFVRGPISSDFGPKRKVVSFQPSITIDSCSAEKRASKLEHHSSFGPWVLLASLGQPLTEQGSDGTKQPTGSIENRPLFEKSTLQETQTSVNSDLCLATKKSQKVLTRFWCKETLFYSGDWSSCLNPLSPSTHLSLVNRCSTLQNTQTFDFSESFCFCSVTRSKRHGQSKQAWSDPAPGGGGVTGATFRQLYFRSLSAGRPKIREARFKVRATRQKKNKSSRFIGEIGWLWCNHFWQRESFHTMVHVAKINFCFFSTMCFYLPIKNVLSEQNAREWRHKSIQRTCTFYHYDCCIQGHTKSDRVETILFNILRGTGPVGLQSLQWKKSFSSFSCQRFFPCPEGTSIKGALGNFWPTGRQTPPSGR